MTDSAVRDAGVAGEVPARGAISDDDVLRAWNELWRRDDEFADIEVVPPNLSDRYDRLLWTGLRRVLEADRRART